MNKVLVLSKGTGQAKAFERVVKEYTNKNSLKIEWIFAGENDMEEIISKGDVAVALIAPEMLVVEKKLKDQLENANVPNFSIKPADFGLKRIEKILPLMEPHLK